jgi:hypothetical protein
MRLFTIWGVPHLPDFGRMWDELRGGNLANLPAR